MKARPPAVVVPDIDGALAPAGWSAIPVEQLPAEPFDLGPMRLAAVARVATTGDAAAVLLAAARGAAVVVVLALDADAAETFLHDLERLTDCATAPDRSPLGEDQVELLRALGEGATVSTAARQLGLSRRTAVRRLAEARRRLGVTSTTEAVRVSSR
jgi:DNA-binding NarL/FixJ family response regulator